MKAHINASIFAGVMDGVQQSTNLNPNGITTDSEDGAIQYLYTDLEDGTSEQILINSEDL